MFISSFSFSLFFLFLFLFIFVSLGHGEVIEGHAGVCEKNTPPDKNKHMYVYIYIYIYICIYKLRRRWLLPGRRAGEGCARASQAPDDQRRARQRRPIIIIIIIITIIIILIIIVITIIITIIIIIIATIIIIITTTIIIIIIVIIAVIMIGHVEGDGLKLGMQVGAGCAKLDKVQVIPTAAVLPGQESAQFKVHQLPDGVRTNGVFIEVP